MSLLFIPSLQGGDWHTLTVKCAIIGAFWGFMIFSVAIDLWSGVERARAVGEKPRSDKFRRTISKIGDYWRVLAFALMLDVVGSILPFYNLPWASVLASIACILIEGKSVLENLQAKKSIAAQLPDLMARLLDCTDSEKMKALLEELDILKNKHKTTPNESTPDDTVTPA